MSCDFTQEATCSNEVQGQPWAAPSRGSGHSPPGEAQRNLRAPCPRGSDAPRAPNHCEKNYQDKWKRLEHVCLERTTRTPAGLDEYFVSSKAFLPFLVQCLQLLHLPRNEASDPPLLALRPLREQVLHRREHGATSRGEVQSHSWWCPAGAAQCRQTQVCTRSLVDIALPSPS